MRGGGSQLEQKPLIRGMPIKKVQCGSYVFAEQSGSANDDDIDDDNDLLQVPAEVAGQSEVADIAGCHEHVGPGRGLIVATIPVVVHYIGLFVGRTLLLLLQCRITDIRLRLQVLLESFYCILCLLYSLPSKG